ncbi:unnamed protein product [Ectocarpus sp. CCAP 1310/34]|nr:unnamed protein product [Ectocarpus sp. CCAP 1310/34]
MVRFRFQAQEEVGERCPVLESTFV